MASLGEVSQRGRRYSSLLGCAGVARPARRSAHGEVVRMSTLLGSGQAAASPGMPTMPPHSSSAPPERDQPIVPTSAEEVRSRAATGAWDCYVEATWNSSRTWWWSAGGTTLRLATAVAAGLSALSTVTWSDGWTQALAVVTAVSAAANVALDPARNTEAHRRAAKDYRRMQIRFNDLRAWVEMRQAALAEDEAIPSEQLEEFVHALLAAEARREAIADASPPRTERLSGDPAVRQDWTRWSYGRLTAHEEWSRRAAVVLAARERRLSSPPTVRLDEQGNISNVVWPEARDADDASVRDEPDTRSVPTPRP